MRVLERSLQAQLDIELQPADFAEIVFARIEEHPVEQRRGRFERRRIAGTQLAVDFDQRLARGANGVLIERARKDHAGVVALGEEDVHAGDAGVGQAPPTNPAVSGLLASSSTSPVWRLTRSATEYAPSRSASGNVHLRHLGLDQFLVERLGDAPVRRDQHFSAARVLDLVRKLAIHQAFGKVPVELAVAQRDALDLIEGAQNVFVGLHAQRAQEDRAQEFALAVDAHVQNVLGVVLELHPGAAVGNDLPQEIDCGCWPFRRRRRASGATG